MEKITSAMASLDERTQRLCERVRRYEDDADPYIRGLIATEVYRDGSELSAVRKRAEILARTLEQIQPVILPETRLLGAAYRRRKVHQGISEPDGWRIQVFFPEKWGYQETWPLPDAVRERLVWWRDHGQVTRLASPLRERAGWLGRYGLAWPHGQVQGHTLPDHGILLRHGIAALRRQVRARLLDGGTHDQIDEWLAMDRCLEGLSAYALHCADAARDVAQETRDPVLTARLEQAASDCEWLATDAPVTFAQALQLLHFSNFPSILLQ